MEIIEILRSIAGLIFVLFIPGLLWSYVFFKKEIDAAERITLSFGLSIALVTLTIFYLNRYLGVKITAFNSFLAVIAICAIAIGILWKNKELAVQNLSLFKSKVKPSKNLAALVAAAYLAHIPHSNYDYPVHRDEWDRLSMSKAVIKAESTTYLDPFLGERVVTNNLEIGFVVWLAELKLMTGLSWWTIFKYFSMFVSILLVLSTYIFANRLGYGLEAAFFVSLIPTTVRLLGPGFLVPVSLGLIFIPISLFLAFNAKNKFYYIALFIVSLFLLYSHPPTALASFIILTPYIILIKKWKILGTITLASLVASPQFLARASAESIVFSTFVRFAEIFKEFGYLPTIFFVIGVFLLHKKGKKDIILVYSTIILLLINLAFRRLDWTLFLMPERNYLYLMLLMSIIGGFTLSKIKYKDKRIWIVAMLLIAFFSYQSHINTPYYRIINDREFNDFVWIKENLEGKAITDPWKAIAFTAVTERHVYSYIGFGPHKFLDQRNREIYEFFENNCSNTTFLINNNITTVYSYVECDNPEIKKIKERTYYLENE
jgi:hypothetical protein